MHLPGPALQVQPGTVPGAELACGLHHDIRAQGRPVDTRRVPLGQHRDRSAADDQRVRGVFHRPAEPAVGRVERQQVRKRPGVGDVVDRHHLQVRAIQRQPREHTPDPTETVDSHPRSHVLLLVDARFAA
jgi:hypothetical protein